MEISDVEKMQFVKRILLSRTRLLCNHPFFGLLLMHINFAVDKHIETAMTDGERIIFGIKFLNDLSDSELDFILMHEVMHIVLKHCHRGLEYDGDLFNIACDIVVNSNILLENNGNLKSITLKKYGVSMHLTPNKKEGHNYTAEQVYEMLIKHCKRLKIKISGSNSNEENINGKGKGITKGQKPDIELPTSFDDHSKWDRKPCKDYDEIWDKRLEDVSKVIEIRKSTCGIGSVPLFAQRILKEKRNSNIDWRTVLTSFVQENIVDYSFMPPDKRYDNGLFLPDFNDKDYVPEKVLFMIDTSGSMSDDAITTAYYEVKGAIDQFNGKLQGWLGFFDATVIEPKIFTDEESFKIIKPVGGGGTSFSAIFAYIKKYMMDDPPTSIIILTDGYAFFPDEKVTMDIPVLWIINNEDITPPWGKVARIKEQ